MITWNFLIRAFCVLLVVVSRPTIAQADNFEQILKPLFAQKCVKCHGSEDVNADVRFDSVMSETQLLEQPELILRTLEAIDTGAMPPDGEESLDETTRTKAVVVLKGMLHEASLHLTQTRAPLRRLNRLQYNNTVRDLFQLNRDVFALPEKLMTRHDNYLQRLTEQPLPRQMPESIEVVSQALNPQPGLQDVKPFPKDLRAEHGFDNQANQLTLSPLLLDAFLRLSVSIVESSDFNEQTVGIWDEFFKAPADNADRKAVISSRLARFLRIAFRGPVDQKTLDRYTAYATGKLQQGLSFTDTMKKVASAVLSSPLFLYRRPVTADQIHQLELAARMSYFLWGSCPDDELLALAERGELLRPDVLERTIVRMLADPKIERFLDTFPTQWMQLENLLAATPDPGINKYFSFDQKAPASLQMVLEPLLLFDAVFVEDRPVGELIAPPFSYHSEFLQTWYTTDLQPPAVDAQQIVAENHRNEQQRQILQATIIATQARRTALLDPVRKRLLEARSDGTQTEAPVDLKPFAAWEFNDGLTETIRGLDLTAHGEITFRDGRILLDQAYLQSQPLPIDLKAKTLEVWFQLNNPDQRGGGLMGIQGPGGLFDTIVIGERMQRHWISGSNGFSRTEDFPESTAETVADEILHLAMVYAEDGTTTLYRNGTLYGKPFRKGQATFPQAQSSVLFGLRHLPAEGNRFLSVSIDQARLYDRALTAEEVAASTSGHSSFISDTELAAALTPQQQDQFAALNSALAQAETALTQVPASRSVDEVRQTVELSFENNLKTQLRSRTFRRVATKDPRYGGIITNAAMLSMTSGPRRTHPVARGVWVIEVIFNDPPDPPPNDVPPLNEDSADKDLTIREQFAAHRENPSCAGCHTKLDPLGFALENFDITGRWRDQYDNGRTVDASGTLMRKHDFGDAVSFKQSLVHENRRFAKAFTEHLLRFALARELGPPDALAVDEIISQTQDADFRLSQLIRSVILSESFLQTN